VPHEQRVVARRRDRLRLATWRFILALVSLKAVVPLGHPRPVIGKIGFVS
jgi:hypothetical protein